MTDSPKSDHWRLDLAPPQIKVPATLFICVVGLGLLAAQANLFLSHRHADGNPAFSTDDIFAVLHGDDQGRPLVTAINGKMRQYVDSEEEARAIIDWAENDGPERAYHLEIADIFSARCIKCHNPSGKSKHVLLTSYQNARKYTERRRYTPTWEHIARVTHVHLLSLAGLWLLVGMLTIFSGPPCWGRTLLAMLPLAGIALDAAGMWLAPLSRPCVYLSLTGGAAMGLGFLLQFILVFYSLWLKPDRFSTG